LAAVFSAVPMPANSDPFPLPEGCVAACRACPHRQWSRQRSLSQKASFLHQALAAWKSQLRPIIGANDAERWHYRPRTKLAMQQQQGAWRWGMEPHGEFLPLGRCPIHQPWINDAAESIMAALPGPETLPLRYWVQNGNQTTLVCKIKPGAVEPLLPELRAKLAALNLPEACKAIWLHAHPAAGRRMFAKAGWFLLRGQLWSETSSGLRHGPTSFVQVQENLHQQSLDEAARWLGANAESKVLDLYCGVGASLRRWRQLGAQCLGVESSSEAVFCTAENAPGSSSLLGHCATRLPQIREWSIQTPGLALAYVNPPRMGLEPEVLRFLIESYQPQRLAYLSCSPGTLARDLKAFSSAGWQVRDLQPYDFFAQTQHIEVLALLKRDQTPTRS
jgi:tRNA/tmRNA/rRNA uracil-C5-methylase (TrmA/RlmC/RlmD family)